ncbi:prolyl oligopeptidase family serine peptidase [Actinoplanes sp. NBRC 103695]|uniref:prolyl oligopeptidase family serine peptidase n=1 Tax=Actinoplanes sp. NBRC 103695 TaxID=3032202 RepID=UPI0024A09106|nr:prolyl oligopeptidase family serine peptidase [Actinoplanes sp. NBRC 103695]GLY93955.1 prolyl endopeptidase [Actinoplanes sp. NBRC 103695]
MGYPPAPRRPVVDDLHGDAVTDPYRWLEDPDDPEVERWQAAQDQLWQRSAGLLPARERFHARIADLTDVPVAGAPVWRGDRCFRLARDSGREHSALRVTDAGGAEVTLLDPAAVDPSGTTTLDQWHPSPDGGLVAVQLSRGGSEQSVLYLLDARDGRPVDGPIAGCRYSPVAWLPDGTAFYYVRERTVVLHQVGTPAGEDEPIFGTGRSGTEAYGVDLSRDGRWLTVSATSGDRPGNDLWLADLRATGPASPRLRVVQEGTGARTVPAVGPDGRMYVLTDLDAPRGRLCVADPARPEPAHWRDLVPEDPEAVLADFVILGGGELPRPVLAVTRVRHALGEVTLHDLGTGEVLGEVPLPGAGTVGSLCTRAEPGHDLWFTYTDHVTPESVLHCDVRARPYRAKGAVTAVAGRVRTRQKVFRSADGTAIRAVVLTEGDGPRPTLLYGYGGFGIPLTPTYSAYTLAWMRAGGTVVFAHLRGGGEEGEQWHRAGMLGRKQNVFDDFVAVAEGLIADGLTTPAQLGICGESNGGLLVGAAVTQRPDLFAAAVCSAPVLDMARYERFGLGERWRGEYGSVADPEQARALLAYSPYHRVREGTPYPAVLFTVFDGDTRVDPLHARKMCAALQHASAGAGEVLLRREEQVGHGARAASRSVALAADMLAFLASHTGLTRSTTGATGTTTAGRP